MANLEKVDHIVVLMLENRSFDHMLGYLSLEGARGDVDGLRGEFANEHDGRSYPIYHLDSTAIADDPDHSASSVGLQVGGGAMNGFVTSFAGTLSRRGVQDGDPARVMGYYNAADVPVYDHLAREFTVCDRWFSSVPGATWPNPLYAICGRAADRLPSGELPRGCRPGTLPSVAWIDPNFSNFNPIGFQPNDHAPADVKDGQELVLAVYKALATSPQWEKTLLIIFYDEHGGFFDHVAPPSAPDDDPQMFGRYGVRVPALIVSPWVEPRSVSTTLFDHTSIIKRAVGEDPRRQGTGGEGLPRDPGNLGGGRQRPRTLGVLAEVVRAPPRRPVRSLHPGQAAA